jgi:hypothetical protein
LRLDLRSLALTRVIYGAILFFDTAVRWTELVPFYTDLGVLPRRFLLELDSTVGFSLHMMNGSLAWVNFLFTLQAVAALAMLFGWHTRLATALSWVLLLSSQARNPMILDGGDVYIRVILFWLLFLPTGHRWSLDSKQGRGDHYRWMPDLTSNNVFGMTAVAVSLQLASIYWFAAIPKTDPSWMVTFTATDQALHLDMFLTPMGLLFRDAFTEYLPLLTFLVIGWEFLGPWLLLFPFDRGQIRVVGILGFTALHVGFGSMMELGAFAWIGALTPFILLPTWFWDSPARRLSNWADRSWGVGPSAKGEARFRWPREVLFLSLLLYCFAWNLGNEGLAPKSLRVPEEMKWVGTTLGLDQSWQLFAPKPLTDDGWYVIEGHFRDGRVRDIFQGGRELSWAKPKNVAKTYRNQRWRKYLMNLWLAENSGYRLPYGQYLCRKWNRFVQGPEDELTEFDIVFMLEETNPDGSEFLPKKTVIWNHRCFDPSP